jgi:tRNA modification GTPase
MQGKDSSSRKDTIVALSSGQLPAGVAVVRVSGPDTRNVLLTLSGSLPQPRMARFGTLRLSDGSTLDTGLTLFFPAPFSFTGEDCGEFQVHGGRAVVDALLLTICGLPGCRLAEAGEFTRRAFLNGKMSLLDAESTADLIAAETEGQRRFAVANASGCHAKLYAGWRSRLITGRALIEAELDFSDESDVPASVSDQVWRDVALLADEIDVHASGYSKAEMLRDGFDVVLLGAPNSGKSSLLNALAQREAAIVTDEPGTTRDLIEVLLNINGFKIRVTDTAGMRDAGGRIEQIGMERARKRAENANLVVLLDDLSDPAPPFGIPAVQSLKVGTKLDLVDTGPKPSGYDYLISSVTGSGMPALIGEIGSRAAAAAPQSGEMIPWRVRHVELLRVTGRHLRRAVANEHMPLELRSEELRIASTSLGRISGQVDVEDLLDVVFGQFCIGK